MCFARFDRRPQCSNRWWPYIAFLVPHRTYVRLVVCLPPDGSYPGILDRLIVPFAYDTKADTIGWACTAVVDACSVSSTLSGQ